MRRIILAVVLCALFGLQPARAQTLTVTIVDLSPSDLVPTYWAVTGDGMFVGGRYQATDPATWQIPVAQYGRYTLIFYYPSDPTVPCTTTEYRFAGEDGTTWRGGCNVQRAVYLPFVTR